MTFPTWPTLYAAHDPVASLSYRPDAKLTRQAGLRAFRLSDFDPDRDIREKLRAKVRKHWLIVAFVLPILLLPGCGVRTIYIPHGTPVRVREAASRADPAK